MKKNMFAFTLLLFFVPTFFSCSNSKNAKIEKEKAQLFEQLSSNTLSDGTRFAILKKIASILHSQDASEMTLFLTNWVEQNPSDMYNAYWLYLVALEYLKNGSAVVSEYYFERVLRDFSDILFNDESVHFLCLQNLIRISKNTRNRIEYYQLLIDLFPEKISITEFFVRLAIEYEKEGEWDNALRSYSRFLSRADASTIQIPDIPDAYQNARKMVDFSKSPKNWTFESLDALEKSIKKAITAYDYKALDSFRSKSNFFMMSWKTTEDAANSQAEFSMRKFMRGNRISFNAELDDSSTPNEAYLRTSGWNTYVGVWYLYFRKVNFPIDPEIHGRWEWAGIYLGEKL